MVTNDTLRDSILKAHQDGNQEGVIQVLSEELADSLKDPARLMRIARTLSEDQSLSPEVRQELQEILDHGRDIAGEYAFKKMRKCKRKIGVGRK